MIPHFADASSGPSQSRQLELTRPCGERRRVARGGCGSPSVQRSPRLGAGARSTGVQDRRPCPSPSPCCRRAGFGVPSTGPRGSFVQVGSMDGVREPRCAGVSGVSDATPGDRSRCRALRGRVGTADADPRPRWCERSSSEAGACRTDEALRADQAGRRQPQVRAQRERMQERTRLSQGRRWLRGLRVRRHARSQEHTTLSPHLGERVPRRWPHARELSGCVRSQAARTWSTTRFVVMAAGEIHLFLRRAIGAALSIAGCAEDAEWPRRRRGGTSTIAVSSMTMRVRALPSPSRTIGSCSRTATRRRRRKTFPRDAPALH